MDLFDAIKKLHSNWWWMTNKKKKNNHKMCEWDAKQLRKDHKFKSIKIPYSNRRRFRWWTLSKIYISYYRYFKYTIPVGTSAQWFCRFCLTLTFSYANIQYAICTKCEMRNAKWWCWCWRWVLQYVYIYYIQNKRTHCQWPTYEIE